VQTQSSTYVRLILSGSASSVLVASTTHIPSGTGFNFNGQINYIV
jgi:hypothetical protein